MTQLNIIVGQNATVVRNYARYNEIYHYVGIYGMGGIQRIRGYRPEDVHIILINPSLLDRNLVEVLESRFRCERVREV